MGNYQRYNEYIDIHVDDIIDYIDIYFVSSKNKIKQDILKMIKKSLSGKLTHYRLAISSCRYDNSGQLIKDGKISLDQTIQSFLKYEYTGRKIATYKSGCGYAYPTYGDELNDKFGEYACNIMNQLIKRYLEEHLKENIAEDDFEKLEDKSYVFDVIFEHSIVIYFNFYEFIFEFMNIDDQLTLKDIK